MCVGGPPSMSYPTVSGSRDTSNELIVSDYELSEENKKKNAEITAKNKAKSLVSFDSGDDDGPKGTGVTLPSSFPSNTPISNYSGMDMSNIG